MDFFGLGGPSELSTPVGALIKSATDPMLIGPDWSKNIEICDQINHNRAGLDAIRALLVQLQSSDPKVVSFALTICESCMKNCTATFPALVNKAFMNELCNIARGSKGFHNQEDALRLIQSWSKMFESRRNEIPIFFETYMSLKTSGIRFPQEESSSAAMTNSAPARSTTSKPAAAPKGEVSTFSSNDEITKLRGDLQTVLDKVRLCREMLVAKAPRDETLMEVVGFLEACRDRMLDLIDAGAAGQLGEDLFEICLRVNDAVQKTLEAELKGEDIAVDDETTAPIDAPMNKAVSASGGLKPNLIDDDDDAFNNLEIKTVKKKTVAGSAPKPIPLIRPPGSKPATSLSPPPKASPATDLLSGDAAPSSSIPSAAPQTTDDINLLFDSLSTGAAPSSAPSSGAAPAAAMSDADFDAFLNSVDTKPATGK